MISVVKIEKNKKDLKEVGTKLAMHIAAQAPISIDESGIKKDILDKELEIIREELVLVQKEYGDERRTEIVDVEEDLTAEDLIPEQDVVVTFSNGGYAKTQPLDTYRSQRRGGRGKSAGTVKEEDFIDHAHFTSLLII